MNRRGEINLKVIGIIFLVFGISAIINTILKTETGLAPILWMSYISLILIGIGVLRKNSSLVASQVVIIGIPYILWNIDFFHYLFNKESLLGITDYFFEPGPLIGKIISLQHLFNLPLSIFSIYLIKLENKSYWKLSLFQITIIFFITRLATTYEQNVNCVYQNCANFDFGIWYPLQWFLSYIMMILITSFLLNKSLIKKTH